ncbi:hypothetical protein [Streptomyces canus]|uniref:hypothetical protein n=1 Tax=Streptomyces canus TaxID=58343 RepID=UPI003800374B
MTYPMDEYPQAIYDSAAAHFGPGPVDPQLVLDRAQLIEDQQREYYNPSADGDCVYPAASTPTSSSSDARRRIKLLDDQEGAYDFLLDDLSGEQRDALLKLAEDSGVGALAQLLDALREERRQKGR